MKRVEVEGGRPVLSWASVIEDATWSQAEALARLPFIVDHVALMPDAHPGYGMPIGGVIACDKAVVPYAVGVDIGCGVALMRIGLSLDDVPADGVQRLVNAIAVRVPVGNGPVGEHIIGGYGHARESDDLALEAPGDILANARKQVGTLGGGNHFIEVQADEEGGIYVMLHSGSRSVGKKVCDHWHKTALRKCEQWHVPLPNKELAFLPAGTDEHRLYLQDMRTAMTWAERNRSAMLDGVAAAVEETWPGVSVSRECDIHHNYASHEEWYGRHVIVHRKGAVSAREGEVVLIPGSMGTASYVGVGLGSQASFASCQHGAGRARSRSETVRQQTEESFAAQMAGVVLGGEARNARDESPFAYKDISVVMADSTDLVRPTKRLRPLGVVKG